MALIKCSECGKEVSDKAKTCPNCGNPTQNKKFDVDKEMSALKKFLIFIIVLMAIGLIAFVFFQSQNLKP